MPSPELLQSVLRFQFGASACFHYLFVPLSLGLLLCINLLATAHMWRGRRHLDVAARYWTRYFLLAWLTGIVTGLPLRWQLQEAWGTYSQMASPVLHAIFAIEGTIAPLMVCGVALITVCRSWLTSWMKMLLGWSVLGLLLWQAFTILAVNAWMQDPVGVSFGPTGWTLLSLDQIMLSPTALLKSTHTLAAAMLTGALFVLAVSGSHVLKGQHVRTAGTSIGIAAWVAMASLCVVILSGHASTVRVAQTQPMKFAAFEAHWQATSGPAPLVLFGIPDFEHKRNVYEVKIPGLMSWLVGDAAVSPPGIVDLMADAELHMASAASMQSTAKGTAAHMAWLSLYDAAAKQDPRAWVGMPAQQKLTRAAEATVPSVPLVFGAFHLMVGTAGVLFVLCVTVFFKRHALASGTCPRLARTLKWGAVLPFVATLSGWTAAEAGRQPWTVYGQLSTLQSSTPQAVGHGIGTLLLGVCGAAVLSAGVVTAGRLIYKHGPHATLRWTSIRQSWLVRLT